MLAHNINKRYMYDSSLNTTLYLNDASLFPFCLIDLIPKWRSLRSIWGERQDHSVFTYGNCVRSCLKIALFHTVLGKCTRKVYEENGMKISFHKFPDHEDVFRQWIVAIRRDIGVNFQVTQNSRVCSHRFKPSDYIHSLTGRKKTLKSSGVSSVFPWMKGSPAKRRAPKHRSLIKKKSPKKTSETTTISDSSNSTCVSSPVDSRENQESPDLENLNNSSAEELLDDRDEKLRNLKSEKAKLEGKIKQLTMEIEWLSAKNNSLQAKVFTIHRFITSDKDLSFYTRFPNASILESMLQYLNPGKEGENTNYWHSSTDDMTNVNQGSDKDAPKQGRPRQLSPREEFVLTLWQGFKEEHLSHLYGISQATVSRIVHYSEGSGWHLTWGCHNIHQSTIHRPYFR